MVSSSIHRLENYYVALDNDCQVLRCMNLLSSIPQAPSHLMCGLLCTEHSLCIANPLLRPIAVLQVFPSDEPHQPKSLEAKGTRQPAHVLRNVSSPYADFGTPVATSPPWCHQPHHVSPRLHTPHSPPRCNMYFHPV